MNFQKKCVISQGCCTIFGSRPPTSRKSNLSLPLWTARLAWPLQALWRHLGVQRRGLILRIAGIGLSLGSRPHGFPPETSVTLLLDSMGDTLGIRTIHLASMRACTSGSSRLFKAIPKRFSDGLLVFVWSLGSRVRGFSRNLGGSATPLLDPRDDTLSIRTTHVAPMRAGTSSPSRLFKATPMHCADGSLVFVWSLDSRVRGFP
jgi:hypothetical protein